MLSGSSTRKQTKRLLFFQVQPEAHLVNVYDSVPQDGSAGDFK